MNFDSIVNPVLKILKKNAFLISLVAYTCAAMFALIGNAGSIGGGFMPVVGGLITLLFTLAIICVVPVLLLLKKEDWAKKAFFCVFVYWIISSAFNLLGGADMMTKGFTGLSIAIGFFEFLIALILLGVITLLILNVIKKNDTFTRIAIIALIGSLFFYLLVWALQIGSYAKYKATWVSYFFIFRYCLFMPTAVIFSLLHFSDAVKAEVVAPVKAEEEVPPAEEPAEEPIVKEDNDKSDVSEPIVKEEAKEESVEETPEEPEVAATEPEETEDVAEKQEKPEEDKE